MKVLVSLFLLSSTSLYAAETPSHSDIDSVVKAVEKATPIKLTAEEQQRIMKAWENSETILKLLSVGKQRRKIFPIHLTNRW